MQTGYIERSKVMELAHQLTGKGYALSQAQQLAWQVEEAKVKMMKNLVVIRFFRKDGALVTKVATMNPAFLPKGKVDILQRETSPLQVIFWSVADKGYRSFLAQNFVSVEEVQSIQQMVQQQFAA